MTNEKLSPKELELLYHFTKVAIIPISICPADLSTITILKEKEMIKEISLLRLEKQNGLVITDKAKSLIKKLYKPIHLPIYSEIYLYQEVKKAHIYFNLPLEVQNTWENMWARMKSFKKETNCNSILKELGLKTWIDARIKIEGKYVAICIKTKGMKPNTFKEKQNVAYTYENCTYCILE